MVENAMSEGLSGSKKGASNHNICHNFSLRRHAYTKFLHERRHRTYRFLKQILPLPSYYNKKGFTQFSI